MKVLIVLVNYFTDSEVLSYIDKFNEEARVNTVLFDAFEIVVFNNGCKLENFKELVVAAGATFVGEGENVGYVHAFRKAISTINKNDYDFIILSNSDLLLSFYNLYSCFNHLLSLNVEYPLIVPKTISSLTGRNQNPYLKSKPKKIKLQLLALIFSSRFTCGVYRLAMAYFRKLLISYKSDINCDNPAEVYAGHGSFFIFTKFFFASDVFNLEMKNFLFGEENFIGNQLEINGKAAYYYPQIEIVHNEHASTGLFPSKTVVKMLRDAHTTAIREYYK